MNYNPVVLRATRMFAHGAAGWTLAAVMSVKKGTLPREVNVAQLQDQLRKDGVDLKRGGKTQENVSAAG